MVESNRDEIAKLEALYAANPEGRVFTHLAEAYRKSGRLDQAREILDEGLKRHADYPSAHVVLGRVLVDAEDHDAAAHAFRRVLELDRHNLIALRALGEIARSSGRSGEALHYYQELSSLDPGNDELARIVRELRDEAGRAGDEAPIGEGWSHGAVDEAIVEGEEAAPEETVEPQSHEADAGAEPELVSFESGPDEPMGTEPIGLESEGGSDTFSEDVPAWAWGEGQPTDEVEVDEPPEPEEDEDVTYGLAGRAFDGFTIVPELATDSAESDSAEVTGVEPTNGGEWVPQDRWDSFTEPAAGQIEPAAAQADWSREPAGEPVGEVESEDFVEVPEIEFEPSDQLENIEGAPSDGWSGPDSGEDELEVTEEDAEEPPDVILEVESIETVSVEIELDADTANAIVAENLPDVREEEPVSWGAPAEVVTETMAEVYAAQGLTERAVEVYRQLRQLRPEDDRIEARLAELEQAIAMPGPAELEAPAEDREAWLEKVESAWTGGEGAVGADDDSLYGWRPDSDESTEGEKRPVGSYFRSLLAWRPAGHAASEESAAARMEEDEAGELEGEAELLLMDEVEGSPPVTEGAAGGASVEAAFDEWFGSSPGGTSDPSHPAAAARGGEPEGSESEEDLEMFRTWLQSLKK